LRAPCPSPAAEADSLSLVFPSSSLPLASSPSDQQAKIYRDEENAQELFRILMVWSGR